MIGKATILTGDAATVLKDMDASSIHCAITSPPYWGLRDYGVDGQLGQEETPEAVSYTHLTLPTIYSV